LTGGGLGSFATSRPGVMRRFLASLRTPPLHSLAQFANCRGLYVAGFPRSGNSWIAYLLSYVTNRPYFDIDGEGLSKERLGLGGLLVGEQHHPPCELFDWVLKTHAEPRQLPLTRNDAVVYIVRDPRDAITSYFYHTEQQWKRAPQWWRRAAVSIAPVVLPRGIRFSLFVRWATAEWAGQVSRALAEGRVIVRYEAVHSSPAATLAEVLDRLGCRKPDADVISGAVELFSFSRMRSVAEQGDPSGHTTRRGAIGDWKTHFSETDATWVRNYAGTLLEALGY